MLIEEKKYPARTPFR